MLTKINFDSKVASDVMKWVDSKPTFRGISMRNDFWSPSCKILEKYSDGRILIQFDEIPEEYVFMSNPINNYIMDCSHYHYTFYSCVSRGDVLFVNPQRK